jgi:hypothetical protein
MRKSYLLPGVLLLIVGCSATPTSPPSTSRHEFSTVRFDNGGMVGSGNILDSGPQGDNTTAASTPLSAEVATDSVGRNGGMVGSGN